MAKQIKTIKCPQCGSSQKTELEPDHYRCDSCGTEYFLDDDDINVNVHHTYDGFDWSKLQLSNIRGTLKWVVGLMLFFFLVPVLITTCSSIFFGHTSSNSSTKTGKSDGLDQDKYTYSVHESTPVVINGKAYIACFASRKDSKSYNYSGTMVYFFYDIYSGKHVSETVFNDGGSRPNNSDMRRFADGNCYLSFNKAFVYKLNKAKMRFEDYLPYIRQTSEEFGSGFATITPANSIDGEAFNIVSNMGEEYRYFPIANKLYAKGEADKAATDVNSLLPGVRDSVIYLFTDDIFPPVKLMEATLKYNAGGPMDTWLIERFTYHNSFFYDGSKIVESHDVTPGHHWFDAHVAYYGHDDLLVSVKVTPADDAQLCIQKIDTKTGKVLWSTPVRTAPDSPGGNRSFVYYDQSIKVGSQYIIKDDRNVYLIMGNNGKLLKEINFKE